MGNPFKITTPDAAGFIQRDQSHIYPVRGLGPNLTVEHASRGARQTFATR